MNETSKHAVPTLERRSVIARQSEKIRFGLVGVVNTVVDFTVLNVLVGVFGVGLLPSNIASTTTAMVTSFALNRRIVFNRGDGSIARQMVLFFAVTLSAIWLVQSGVMFGAYQLLESQTNWNETLILNIAKLLGIGAGLVWNYMWYSRVVFSITSNAKK